jgi:hypothetical protein
MSRSAFQLYALTRDWLKVSQRLRRFDVLINDRGSPEPTDIAGRQTMEAAPGDKSRMTELKKMYI